MSKSVPSAAEGNLGTTRSFKPDVFAAGDIVAGGATVILATGAGRKAAASIHDYLTTGTW
jgi:glutamate synthase (NADPH/NADH) small chain